MCGVGHKTYVASFLLRGLFAILHVWVKPYIPLLILNSMYLSSTNLYPWYSSITSSGIIFTAILELLDLVWFVLCYLSQTWGSIGYVLVSIACVIEIMSDSKKLF